MDLNLARRVEERLGNDADEITDDWTKEQHRTSTGKVDAAMRDIALEVILRHPGPYALLTLLGLYQSLIEVTGALSLIGALWNIALMLAAAVGLWRLLRRRRWLEALFLLLPPAYFISGTVLVCTTCMDTRARVMITPLLAVMAAYGVMRLFNRRKAALASPSPPADS